MNPSPQAPFAHELRPGDRYTPLQMIISAEVNEQFLYALADFDPTYVGSEDEPGIVHPVVLLHMSARTRSPSFRLAPDTGSVFAKDIASFSRPAIVGETLDIAWIIRDVYEKRGRLYQALDTRVTNATGDVVMTRQAHSLFFTNSGVALPLPG